MDSLISKYRHIIENVLREYADFISNDEEVQVELIFDRERDRYLVVETGWQNGYRIYGTFLHIDIINDQVWIQHDGTEDGIADELIAAGIAKEDMVLAFKPPEIRKYIRFTVG